jgi:hypothetical protein
MKNKSSEGKGIKEFKAQNILNLVKDHKKHCNGDCGISLFLLLEDFERHIGRKATSEEFKNFI